MDDRPHAHTTGRGMLRGAAAGELVRTGFADEVRDAPRLARGLSVADIAHIMELAHAGELEEAVAARILGGLLELDAPDGPGVAWDPAVGDPFTNRERALAGIVGDRDAGWLSAGRPRREALRIALRLTARDATLELVAALASFAGAVAGLARTHAGDLAADYTYLQPAQPTTIGHQLLHAAWPALRDSSRLQHCFADLDLSVAGVGGTCGSRWKIDRDRLSTALGHRGLVSHTRDAMWQVDTYLELLSATAIVCGGLSQVAQDLEIWCSGEFGFVTLADTHSRESALMPQKRNPYALVAVRTQAARAAGDIAAALVAVHTGSARTDHFQLLNGIVPKALDRTRDVANLLAEVIRSMTIHVDTWAAAAHTGGVCAADLADVVATRSELDYRTAHTVVGQALRARIDAGQDIMGLSATDLDDTARRLSEPEPGLSAEEVGQALDPAACIGERHQSGSCTPESMTRMLDEVDRDVGELATWSADERIRIDGAVEALFASAARLGRVGTEA